jgi:nicotinate-nucleotide adenylyltransferase
MCTIVFGGSFDPPHIGHLYIAEMARLQLKASRVLFLPSGNAILKPTLSASPQQRLDMLTLALQSLPWAEINTFDIADALNGTHEPHYAIDTIKYFIAQGITESAPYYLLGSDWVPGFYQWKESQELAQLVKLVIANRKSETDLSSFNYPHYTINCLPLSISSSGIRHSITHQQSYQFFLPSGVYNYIEQHRLYR